MLLLYSVLFSVRLNRILAELSNFSSRPSSPRQKKNCRYGYIKVEWEAGPSDTQQSLRKDRLSYLLVAKIFMPKVESDKSRL